jgi:two-component system LytT family response regulator/two-component system response regulator LytT
MMRVLIADDERPARDELRWLLEKERDLEVVGEAENGMQVLAFLEKNEADLILLDIQMPGMTGLETARELMALPGFPQIIFITAFDRYAIEAFDVNALDYLLKPVEQERLSRALNRARNRLVSPESDRGMEESLINMIRGMTGKGAPRFEKLTVYHEGRFIPLSFNEIILMTAEGKHSLVVSSRGSFPYRKSLGDLEALVESPRLFKCHRSYTVNLDYLEAVEPWFNNAYKIKLKGVDELVPVSRSRVGELKSILNMD